MKEAIETEVKIGVDDGTFEEVYAELGRPRFSIQKNLIYSVGKAFLRLRQELGKTILTVKGARQEGEFTCREEVESQLTANVFEEMRKIMPEAFYYEKKRAEAREPYCIIFFDILSDGRKYIEIEGKEFHISKHRKKLGLENHPVEKRNYLELLGEIKNGQ